MPAEEAAGGKSDGDFVVFPNKLDEDAAPPPPAWSVLPGAAWPNKPPATVDGALPVEVVGVEEAPNRPVVAGAEEAAVADGVDEAPPKRPPPVCGVLAAPPKRFDDPAVPAPPNNDGPLEGVAVEVVFAPPAPTVTAPPGLAPALPNKPPPAGGFVAPGVEEEPNEKGDVPEDAPPNRPPEAGADVVVAWPGAALELGAPKLNAILTIERSTNSLSMLLRRIFSCIYEVVDANGIDAVGLL